MIRTTNHTLIYIIAHREHHGCHWRAFAEGDLGRVRDLYWPMERDFLGFRFFD